MDDEASPATSSTPVSATPAPEFPVWLREDPVPVVDNRQANVAVASGYEPAWSGRRGTETATRAAVEEEDIPDWLRFPAYEPDTEHPRAAIPTEEQASSLPPWLADLALSDAENGGSSGSAAIDLPVWLREEPAVVEDNATSAPSPDLPDWLQEADEPAQRHRADEAKPQPDTASLPAWLRDDQLDTTGDAGDDLVLSWLQETDVDRSSTSSVVDSTPSRTGDANQLPAWLVDIDAVRAVDQPQTAQTEPPAPVDAAPAAEQSFDKATLEERPNWLLAESAAPPDEDTTTQTVVPNSIPQPDTHASAALPSWLLPTAEEREVEATPSVGKLPEWLSLPDEPLPNPAQDQVEPGPEHVARIYPDAEHVARIYPGLEHVARTYAMPDTEAVADTASNGQTDTLPPWLVDEAPATPGPARVLPSWLDEPEQLETQAPGVVASVASADQPSEASDLPTWLHDPQAAAGSTTLIEAAPATPPDQQVDIAVEPAATPTVVTPAEPVIQRTPERVASMELLQRLVLEAPREPMVSPVVQRRARAVMLVQIVAFALLLAAILVALLGPRLPLGTGERVPSPNAARLATRIAALVPGAPVLVAYEWDARRAAEMEPLEDAVVAQLMARRAPLLLLTTDPQGALLSRRRAALLRERQDNFYDKAGLGFVDLGYKPGGAFALARMSSSFGSVFEQDWTGASLTGQANVIQTMCQSPAGNVADCNLDRVGMVIVLADESEDARVWIEQVESKHPTLPISFVTPAEVAPLVQPYLTGPNITIAAGLGDAVGLQTFGGQANAGLSRRADANAIGGAVFGILALLGIIPAIWSGRRARQAGRTGAWER